jgi:hypothetical protein
VTDDAAAAERDRAKRAHYARTGVGDSYDLVPLSVESFGRLGKPAMGLLNALADVAASGGGEGGGVFCKIAFVTSALRRLSVALCRDNGRMYGESLFTLASTCGRAFQPGLLVSVAN